MSTIPQKQPLQTVHIQILQYTFKQECKCISYVPSTKQPSGSDLFEGLSDLQLEEVKVILNHLVHVYSGLV